VVSFIVFARPLEPFADEVNIRLGGANARGRLLLERVQDALEANRIDRTVGVAIEALDNSKTPAPSPFHGLAAGCLPPS
jgi:hypothetical protein